MSDFSVEANGLTKYFGNYKAVDHVSLAVPTGSIYGVLGPNGAGKTTSLRMTLGIIDPDEGTSRL
ncbi:MAG: ATP-binding cassette domain-containing protein, partial [Sphingopyxis sp.]